MPNPRSMRSYLKTLTRHHPTPAIHPLSTPFPRSNEIQWTATSPVHRDNAPGSLEEHLCSSVANEDLMLRTDQPASHQHPRRETASASAFIEHPSFRKRNQDNGSRDQTTEKPMPNVETSRAREYRQRRHRNALVLATVYETFLDPTCGQPKRRFCYSLNTPVAFQGPTAIPVPIYSSLTLEAHGWVGLLHSKGKIAFMSRQSETHFLRLGVPVSDSHRVNHVHLRWPHTASKQVASKIRSSVRAPPHLPSLSSFNTRLTNGVRASTRALRRSWQP